MRKIIAGMFITLDGVVEAPERWNPPETRSRTCRKPVFRELDSFWP